MSGNTYYTVNQSIKSAYDNKLRSLVTTVNPIAISNTTSKLNLGRGAY